MKKIRNIIVAIIILTAFCGISTMAAEKEIKLTNKKWYTYQNTDNSKDPVNFKIQVNGTGYVKIEGNGYSTPEMSYKSGLIVNYYNQNWKQMHSSSYRSVFDHQPGYFAVKKGTYYIQVPSYYKVDIRYTFVNVKEKSGSKKSKAVTIKKNKTAKGTLQFGESLSKTDWYKIKLTKKQKVNIYFTGGATYFLNLEIIPASKKTMIINNRTSICIGTNVWKSAGKLPKGTYYIKVNRSTVSSKEDCGMYTVRWK
ncbi:MAG: hypothetical protein Q4B70_01560 [Lachnospiraceae bacterium]|nr:hypothetical protein [Lachnospiraceae bacterium]